MGHRMWTVQLGPFAEHVIEVEKKYQWSKAICLSVDGTPLVEATAADLGCDQGWHCDFRLLGERCIDFEVFETNRDGLALDTKAHVLQKRHYTHQLSVHLGEDLDMASAGLVVDGNDFLELPDKTDGSSQEVPFSLDAQALKLQYGVTVPYKVNQSAPCGFFSALRSTATPVGDDAGDFWSWFGVQGMCSGCCSGYGYEQSRARD